MKSHARKTTNDIDQYKSPCDGMKGEKSVRVSMRSAESIKQASYSPKHIETRIYTETGRAGGEKNASKQPQTKRKKKNERK